MAVSVGGVGADMEGDAEMDVEEEQVFGALVDEFLAGGKSDSGADASVLLKKNLVAEAKAMVRKRIGKNQR